MNPYLVAPIVFACIFAATLLGMRLNAALPEHHLQRRYQGRGAGWHGPGRHHGRADSRLARRLGQGFLRYREERGDADGREVPSSTAYCSITGRKPTPPDRCCVKPWRVQSTDITAEATIGHQARQSSSFEAEPCRRPFKNWPRRTTPKARSNRRQRS